MKKIKLFIMVMALLLVTACGEEKLYTVEELTENAELRKEVIANYQSKKNDINNPPTEIESENSWNAAKIEQKLNPKEPFKAPRF